MKFSFFFFFRSESENHLRFNNGGAALIEIILSLCLSLIRQAVTQLTSTLPNTNRRLNRHAVETKSFSRNYFFLLFYLSLFIVLPPFLCLHYNDRTSSRENHLSSTDSLTNPIAYKRWQCDVDSSIPAK